MSINQTQNRLGKGLEALIPKTYFASGKTIINIPLAEIRPNPFQPRAEFNDEALNALVESIKSVGVAQPVLVRRVGNYYELIAGERRFRASKLAGVETIPAIIRNATDQESLQLALIENLQRENLNAIETAKGYVRLIEEFQITHQDLSQLFGRSRSSVTNLLRLLSLPQVVQDALIAGKITEGHARALLSFKTEEEILKNFELILSDKLNVRDVEKMDSENKKEKIVTLKDNVFLQIEKELTSIFKLPFQIKGKPTKGKIEIAYSSKAEFESLYAILKTRN